MLYEPWFGRKRAFCEIQVKFSTFLNFGCFTTIIKGPLDECI